MNVVEEREAKLLALRETLNAAIAEEGNFTDDDVTAAIEAKAGDLAKEGY